MSVCKLDNEHFGYWHDLTRLQNIATGFQVNEKEMRAFTFALSTFGEANESSEDEETSK